MRPVDSLTHLARLVVGFAAIVTMAAPQGSSPSTDSCADGHFIATCAYPGLMFVNTSLGMYCLNDNTDIFGYNWTWYVGIIALIFRYAFLIDPRGTGAAMNVSLSRVLTTCPTNIGST